MEREDGVLELGGISARENRATIEVGHGDGGIERGRDPRMLSNVAAKANTIAYEIMVTLGPRVQRVYG